MREDILAYLATREEKVMLGAREVTVRELESAADTAAFLDNTDMTWKLLVRCVLGADGNPVFSDEDIPRLKKSGKLRMVELVAAVRRVNGLAIEDAEKNSGAGPGAG